MKKILSLTLIAIMLLSAFILTSCDAALEMLQDYLDSQTTPNNTNPDSTTPSTEDDTKTEPTPDEVRYTITEDEWNAVVNSTNFTIEAPDNTIMKTETEAKVSTEKAERYLVLRDGIYYEVASVDGEWIGLVIEDDGSLLTPLSSFIDLRNVDFFETFTFNEESNSYIYEIDGEKAEFYFENGKLVRGDIDGEYIIHNVGMTVINVPEFRINNESDSTTDETPEIDDSFLDGENDPEE